MNGFSSIIYGMSSFPLTNSYFSMWLKPPSSYSIWSSHDFTIEKIMISPILEMSLAENGKTTNNMW